MDSHSGCVDQFDSEDQERSRTELNGVDVCLPIYPLACCGQIRTCLIVLSHSLQEELEDSIDRLIGHGK